jgi:antitoxin component of MazEF toxin-antitoxin module
VRRRLVAIGNSLGIIIEKPILDLLGMERDTELEVSTDGKRLILAPIPPGQGRAKPHLNDVRYAQLPEGWERSRIRLLRPDNPKRPGGKPRERFALYKDGMTGAAAIAAGVWEDDLQWDLKHKYIDFE